MAETLRPDRREHALTGERATLEAFLDDYRDILVRKVFGLSDADVRRHLVPSPTTVGGLVKHLRELGPVKAAGWFAKHGEVPELLDRWGGFGRQMAISEHEDQVLSVEHGYAPGI